jgi:hypothetical protein
MRTISYMVKRFQGSNSDAYETEMDSFKSQLDQVAGDYYSEWGSMSLTSSNSTTDMYLALHNVGYLMAAEKINGDWDIYIWVYDTYDFEYWNFNDVSSVPDAFVTLINNYAAASMELGAIVEYNINIYIVDEY